jgi:hypothetical protein
VCGLVWLNSGSRSSYLRRFSLENCSPVSSRVISPKKDRRIIVSGKERAETYDKSYNYVD